MSDIEKRVTKLMKDHNKEALEGMCDDMDITYQENDTKTMLATSIANKEANSGDDSPEEDAPATDAGTDTDQSGSQEDTPNEEPEEEPEDENRIWCVTKAGKIVGHPSDLLQVVQSDDIAFTANTEKECKDWKKENK